MDFGNTTLAVQFIELIVLIPLISMAVAILPILYFARKPKPCRVPSKPCCRARK